MNCLSRKQSIGGYVMGVLRRFKRPKLPMNAISKKSADAIHGLIKRRVTAERIAKDESWNAFKQNAQRPELQTMVPFSGATAAAGIGSAIIYAFNPTRKRSIREATQQVGQKLQEEVHQNKALLKFVKSKRYTFVNGYGELVGTNSPPLPQNWILEIEQQKNN